MNWNAIGWGILWIFILLYTAGVLVNYFQTA